MSDSPDLDAKTPRSRRISVYLPARDIEAAQRIAKARKDRKCAECASLSAIVAYGLTLALGPLQEIPEND